MSENRDVVVAYVDNVVCECLLLLLAEWLTCVIKQITK